MATDYMYIYIYIYILSQICIHVYYIYMYIANHYISIMLEPTFQLIGIYDMDRFESPRSPLAKETVAIGNGQLGR